MKKRYRLICRNLRGGKFYIVDSLSGKRESLGTASEDEAEQIVQAKNQAQRQPIVNLQIAKAYLGASDPHIAKRTWQDAFNAIIELKSGATKERWQRGAKEKPFDRIRNRLIIETQAEEFFAILNAGTVSTNVHLRKIHNFCLDLNWLPWPILSKKQWPPIRYQDKRAISLEEHNRIVERERNPEFKIFYSLLWHLGGSQSDIATLKAGDIDWQDRTIAYARKKTGSPALAHFSEDLATLLRQLPSEGLLFPGLARTHEKHRAKEFKRRCVGLGISGITLHSYRYAWAERARACGYPERFAQQALGHNSKAVHRVYSKKAHVKLPSLEDYEKEAKNKIVSLRPNQPITKGAVNE